MFPKPLTILNDRVGFVGVDLSCEGLLIEKP
jgi:hypothetical protein